MLLDFTEKMGAAWRMNLVSAVRSKSQMGTLGKAFGASGGYICGSRKLVDLLISRARSFIFSTAPVPATAAAATAAVRLVRSDEGKTRRDVLWQLIKQLNPKSTSAIIPLIIGDETKAVNLAAQMREKNIFIPAIRYPTVARGSARLRVTLTAAHTFDEIATLTQTFAGLKFGVPDLESP